MTVTVLLATAVVMRMRRVMLPAAVVSKASVAVLKLNAFQSNVRFPKLFIQRRLTMAVPPAPIDRNVTKASTWPLYVDAVAMGVITRVSTTPAPNSNSIVMVGVAAAV
jgi:hypothetical protein